ncbi:beta-glucosidase 40 [Micractinium conductrix]|uniref:Beta-glucosidase 40 n=1 Tax=Micractinium conductrix TaxID=554055 RepID=A0A2P6VE58_9CHLO|nr:beta-glucosidase 40 [Micractinium conductrix]|eukprot:PSC72359.1 beta-glucosidase 40 [Micractinium conductrix]
MRSLGVRNFRLSLSWTRLLPHGTGEPNQEGVAFYSRLIDALGAACIEPFVTLYHWDFPLSLYEQYGGWTTERVVADFTAYAEVAFKLFGDRVKNWVTLNEPETFCDQGYGSGVHAPGRCSDRARCTEGDSSTEPHLCSYYALLAHASAVRSFRKLVPGGRIAMSTSIGMSVPLTDSAADVAAADRQQTFNAGHFLDPIYTGDWSDVRKAAVGSVLPAFTPQQRQLLLDTRQDFIALQHYTARYTYHNASAPPLYASDTTVGADGVPLPRADSPWLHVFPSAFRDLLGWLHRRYNQTIIVTENGCSAPGEGSRPMHEVLCDLDRFRVDYFRQYIGNATAAVEEDGVMLEGYFAWSLLDNFE